MLCCSSLLCFLQATEDFIVHLFEDCNLCAIHAKRVTISEHMLTWTDNAEAALELHLMLQLYFHLATHLPWQHQKSFLRSARLKSMWLANS